MPAKLQEKRIWSSTNQEDCLETQIPNFVKRSQGRAPSQSISTLDCPPQHSEMYLAVSLKLPYLASQRLAT